MQMAAPMIEQIPTVPSHCGRASNLANRFWLTSLPLTRRGATAFADLWNVVRARSPSSRNPPPSRRRVDGMRFESCQQLIQHLFEARTEFRAHRLLEAPVGRIDLRRHAGGHGARPCGE